MLKHVVLYLLYVMIIAICYFASNRSRSVIQKREEWLDLSLPLLSEYAAYHKAARRSANASYLVYVCDASCGGIGDRLRGMLWLFKVAVATRRVFCAVWRKVPIDAFLVPAEIDWRMPFTVHWDSIDAFNWVDSFPNVRIGNKIVSLQTFDIREFFDRHRQTVYVRTNMISDAAAGNLKFHSDADREIIRMLFTFSPAVQRHTNRYLAKYGLQHNNYVSVHLRFAGSVGEADSIIALHCTKSNDKQFCQSRFRTFFCSLICADRILLRYRNLSTPILIFTDNLLLRKFARTFQVRGVQVVDVGSPHHLDKSDSRDVQDYIPSFTEFSMMARSACLLHGASGFSQSAALFNSGKCIDNMTRCMSLVSECA